MIRINDSQSQTTLKAAVLVSVFLLFAAVMGFGQQVNLTAGPAATTLPDGTVIPMWGYSCGAAATGSTASCAPLSGTGAGTSNGAATGALGGIYVVNGGSGYSSRRPASPSVPRPGLLRTQSRVRLCHLCKRRQLQSLKVA